MLNSPLFWIILLYQPLSLRTGNIAPVLRIGFWLIMLNVLTGQRGYANAKKTVAFHLICDGAAIIGLYGRK